MYIPHNEEAGRPSMDEYSTQTNTKKKPDRKGGWKSSPERMKLLKFAYASYVDLFKRESEARKTCTGKPLYTEAKIHERAKKYTHKVFTLIDSFYEWCEKQ